MESEQAIQSARVTVILEELVKRVDTLNNKVEQINTGFIVNSTSQLAVTADKVRRLETIVYGALTVIVAELIGLVFLLFKNY